MAREFAHDLGDEHQRRYFAAVAARFRALRNDDVDTRFGLADGMFLGPDQRSYRHAALLAFLYHRGWCNAQCVGNQPDGMSECDFHQGKAVLGGDTHAFAKDRHLGFGRNSILAENGIDEALIGGIDSRSPALVVGQFADARIDHFGNENIHTVRGPVHMRIDPGKLFLELLGTEARSAQHPEPARLADGSHNVATVAEGEKWKLRPGQFTYAVHRHGYHLLGDTLSRALGCASRPYGRVIVTGASPGDGFHRVSGGNTSSRVPFCQAP